MNRREEARQNGLHQIADRFRLQQRIGSGSFGEVYQADDLLEHRPVAVKTERTKVPLPQLPTERAAFERLSGSVGFPRMIYYGQEKEHYVLIMDLLGPSLEDLFNFCNRSFTLHTACMVIDQAVSRTKQMHQRSLLHRDIKPDNFLMGVGPQSHILYFVDFGLSKQYHTLGTNAYRSAAAGKSLTGTARYASLHTHLGYEQARRDDLEGIVYSLLYFLRGSLPWQGLKARTKQQKYERIAEMKQTLPAQELCAGLPTAIGNVYVYVKSLAFNELPDYEYIKTQLRTAIVANAQQYDYRFDWLERVTPRHAS